MKEIAKGFIVLNEAVETNGEGEDGSAVCFSSSKAGKNRLSIGFVLREGGKVARGRQPQGRPGCLYIIDPSA